MEVYARVHRPRFGRSVHTRLTTEPPSICKTCIPFLGVTRGRTGADCEGSGGMCKRRWVETIADPGKPRPRPRARALWAYCTTATRRRPRRYVDVLACHALDRWVRQICTKPAELRAAHLELQTTLREFVDVATTQLAIGPLTLSALTGLKTGLARPAATARSVVSQACEAITAVVRPTSDARTRDRWVNVELSEGRSRVRL